MNMLFCRLGVLSVSMMLVAALIAFPVFAQNSNIQNLIQAYKEQNPQAAQAMERNTQSRRTGQSIPPGQLVSPQAVTTIPYHPHPQPATVSQLPYQPTQSPVPVIPTPNPAGLDFAGVPATSGVAAHAMEPANPSADYRRLEQPKEPPPLGGNPKDPLNVRFDPKWVGQSNRAATPYDEMIADARLNDVFFVNAQCGWAVGDRGAVWHTNDAGRNWMLQETPIACTLRSVFFLDESFGLAVGGYLHPSTTQGRGVALITTDGGKRWSMVSIDRFPVFHRVRMFDPTKGIIAGESSELCPSGLFATQDGGRTWRPLPGDKNEGWASIDFLDEKTGIGIGCHGSIQSLTATKAIQIPVSNSARFSQARLVHEKTETTAPGMINGWLVGDQGLVLSTMDRGGRWSVVPGKLPGNAATLIDLKTLDCRGNLLWVAGNPGSFVYYSGDAGKTWKSAPTGQTATIRKLVFIDEENGWAVGDLGTVLATRDGGKTWNVQRAGASRLAMLGVFGRAGDIPLEAFVQICANQGYLGGALLLFRDEERFDERLESACLDRFHEAVVRIGGSGVWQLGPFDLEHTELQTTFQRLVNRLNRANDGKGIQRIRERLVMALRQWRPEIVVSSHHGDPSRETASGDPVRELVLRELVLRELVQAVKLAEDPTAFPYQLTELGLEPWKVKKMHLALPDGKLGDVNITTTEPIVRLGQPVDEIVYASYGIIAADPTINPATDRNARPAIIGFSTQSDLASSTGHRDFFAGIDLPPGGDGRRTLLGSYAERWEEISLRIKQRRHALGIIEQTAKAARDGGCRAGDVRLASNAEELTRKIDRDAAVQALLDMGRQYHAIGNEESAQEAYELIVGKYADHPLARSAFLWLVQYYAGEEITWRKHRNNKMSLDSTSFDKYGNVARIGGAASAMEGHEAGGRLDRAISLGRLLNEKHPELARDVRSCFALASAFRRRGFGQEAASFYQSRGDRRYDDVWSMRARAEHWLTIQDKSELPPERRESPMPSIVCSMASKKPYLDGQFDRQYDQGTWFQSKLHALTPEKPRKRLQEILKDKPAGAGARREERLRNESRNFGTNVMVMYDREYLYVGVRCKRIDGFLYPPVAEKPRTRDAAIDDQDRIEILLDTDRDYGSYYCLSIDSRGWAVDSCWGDKSWNPNCFIARHEDKGYWYIEAAISLDSLAEFPPMPQSVWGIGLRRIVPGVGIECWNAENSFDLKEGLGFLVFE